MNETMLAALCTVGIQAATEAGRYIASQWGRSLTVQEKQGGVSRASQVVTEVDHHSQTMVLRHLEPTCSAYGLALLSEERADDRNRLEAEYFWCIDPLDGTLNFIEAKPGVAVSIALVARDGTPWLGIVYDPLEDALLSAIRGQGVVLNGKPWPHAVVPPSGPLRIFNDRSFALDPRRALALEGLWKVAEACGYADLICLEEGGAVKNVWRLMDHAPSCYFKFPRPEDGGGSLWDFAATSCILQEWGGSATDFYGQPLDLNRRDSTFMNHRGVVMASDPKLAQNVQALWPNVRSC